MGAFRLYLHDNSPVISSRSAGNGCPYCAGRKAVADINDVATTNPEVLPLWNYDKNNQLGLKPSNFKAKSGHKVWWKCEYGHEWESRIAHVVEGSGCPYCSGKQVLAGYNDLATTRPELVKEWNYGKNAGLLPTDVTAGSNKTVWWKCKEGHEWKVSVNERNRNIGCPYCSGHRVLSGYNDLATTRPKLAKEWNYEKNADLKPTDVTAGSNKTVWWKCKEGHEWQAKIGNRTFLNRSCPYCTNQSILLGYNDLASQFPDLAKEWHTTKNGTIKPTDVVYGSFKKVWWLGKCGHEWEATISHRVNGTDCPICAKGRQTSFPEQALYYYLKKEYTDAINSFKDIFDNGMEIDIYIPSKRIGIEYDGVAYHKTQKSYEKEKRKYTICKQNNIKLIRIKENVKHTFDDTSDILLYSKFISTNYSDLDSAIKQLSQYLQVPTKVDCEKDKQIIQEQYLTNLKGNSITEIKPELTKEWHPTKNASLKPEMYSAGSSQKVWWMCSNGHEWKAVINNRVKGIGCPICSGHKVLSGYNDLKTIKPELCNEWNYEKNPYLKPTEVTAKSNKKVWWKCKNGHEWQAVISSRSAGNGCPYCAGRKAIAGINDVATTNPFILKIWDCTKNKDILPQEVTSGSHKRVWWKCPDCGYEWKTTVYDRCKSKGCPKCKAKNNK